MEYEKSIAEIGLPEKEAAVYGTLLSVGEAGAKELLQKLHGIKRPNLYALLASLQAKGLVSESEKPGKMRFRAESPERLKEIATQKIRQAKESEGILERILPLLISQWNLASGKPTIQFLEGAMAIKKIALDSLASRTDILSYVDSERLNAVLGTENKDYVKKRTELGVKKRIIYIDSPQVRNRAKELDPTVTEIRVISGKLFPFSTVMQIYEDKVSYLTLDPKQMVGVIIHDKAISQMHRSLFEHSWAAAEKIAEEGEAKDNRKHNAKETREVGTHEGDETPGNATRGAQSGTQ